MDQPDRAIVAAYKAIRTAEQAQLEWDRSFNTGEWELIARPPTGGVKVIETEDRHPDTLQREW